MLTGIVVERHDYAETDRIVRLLTPDEGRVAVLVRRARTRAGAVDLAARVRATVRHGRGTLDVLADVELEDPRTHLRGSLGRLAAALYACELCGALAHEGQPEPRLYGLLETALLVLDATASDPGPAFRIALEAKALSFAGVGPALHRCAVCGGGVEAPMVFSATAGGAAHGRCATGVAVAPEVLAAAEQLRRTPLQDVVDRAWGGPPDLLYDAVRAHLDRELRTRALLGATG